MVKLNIYEEWLKILNNNEKKLLYTMTTGCSVCHADYPRVKALVEEEQISGYYLMADEIPEAAGQLSLFTSPVVMLFNQDREYHRQARIIDFETLHTRMKQLKLEY
ncbi:thioredoxin [Macrococcus brunensis]|uniref:Thioredoxin n=1 Tax=Macrococcus brunensis TaxID=198483 RepID=A0A4R6BBB5_9STAP|nr:thioredoxin family protein [Macrococcus brunensis]TDL94269.1 thioredoxin [Macrococcus brunensis]